uniref:Uncharacterized protein n=1 Tax=viral metagenome TaxID=1070528 RepID=A0A6H2A5P3_9ZZZZ
MAEETPLELMLKCQDYYNMACKEGLIGVSESYLQVIPEFLSSLEGATLSIKWAGKYIEVRADLNGIVFIGLI